MIRVDRSCAVFGLCSSQRAESKGHIGFSLRMAAAARCICFVSIDL